MRYLKNVRVAEKIGVIFLDIRDMENILYNTRKLSTENDVKLYEETIAKICSYNKPEYIVNLCKGFYDDTEDYEVMFGLVHAVEYLGGDDCLYWISLGLVDADDTREWGKIFMYGLLNNRKTLNKIPVDIKRLPPKNKEYIVALLEEIKKEKGDRFGERIDAIFKKICE